MVDLMKMILTAPSERFWAIFALAVFALGVYAYAN